MLVSLLSAWAHIRFFSGRLCLKLVGCAVKTLERRTLQLIENSQNERLKSQLAFCLAISIRCALVILNTFGLFFVCVSSFVQNVVSICLCVCVFVCCLNALCRYSSCWFKVVISCFSPLLSLLSFSISVSVYSPSIFFIPLGHKTRKHYDGNVRRRK